MNTFFKYFLFSLFVLFSLNVEGQFEMADSSNRVVIKPFSPPVGAVIQDLLYTQAKVFLAPDVFGINHNLLNYRGKSVVLFFVDKDCGSCLQGIDALEEIGNKHNGKIEIFVFSNENRKELLKQYKNTKPGFKVMFNSKVFGEMMYAGSLGYPRLFFVNKEGYTTKILPAETFEQTKNIKKLIINTIGEVEQGRKEIQN